MPSRPSPPWVSKLVVALVLIVPISVFFITQAISIETRSGSLEEVWRVKGAAGPLVLARDQIVVGTEKSAKLRNRLSLLDATTGERLVREPVDDALEFFAQDAAGLWFRRKLDGGDVHVRNVKNLERLDTTSKPPAANGGSPRPVTAPVIGAPHAAKNLAQVTDSAPELPLLERFVEGEWILGEEGTPLLLESPASALIVHQNAEEPGHLQLSRVALDGSTVWAAKLERQRGIRAAWRQDGAVLLVTAGAARDFALLLDEKTGATRWVYYF